MKILLCSSLQFLLYPMTLSFFLGFSLLYGLRNAWRSQERFFLWQSEADNLCPMVSV